MRVCPSYCRKKKNRENLAGCNFTDATERKNGPLASADAPRCGLLRLLEFRLKIKDSRIFSFLGFDDIGNRERGREREGREKRRRREIRFSTRRLLFRVSTNDRIDIVIFLPLPSSSSSSSSFSSSFFLPSLLHIPFVLNAAR